METYLKLNLTKQQVIEMQHWLYPKLTDPEIKSMAEIIDQIVDKYKQGDLRHYALYHLGYITSNARALEVAGMPLILNPDVA